MFAFLSIIPEDIRWITWRKTESRLCD